MRPHPLPPVVAVVGATAVGKSDLGVALALRLGGEVVNADSMQLYRGMDVGTAKLTEAEQGGVVHHLLDVWDVSDEANVADYQHMARAAFAAARARGPGRCWSAARGSTSGRRWTAWSSPAPTRRCGAGWRPSSRRSAPARCTAGWPRSTRGGRAILPSNGRRLVRALEVVELTGRPFTAALPEHDYEVPAVQVGLTLPRPELDARIADRVDGMWERGLVEEVRRLVDAGLREGRTASRALGYAQVLRHLAGEWTEEQARDETVRATRRFARRQESWFRRDPRVEWLDAADPDLVGRALGEIARVSDLHRS